MAYPSVKKYNNQQNEGLTTCIVNTGFSRGETEKNGVNIGSGVAESGKIFNLLKGVAIAFTKEVLQ